MVSAKESRAYTEIILKYEYVGCDKPIWNDPDPAYAHLSNGFDLFTSSTSSNVLSTSKWCNEGNCRKTIS